MTLRKTTYIKDILDNQKIDDFFLIKEMRQAETKTGKPYLTLVLLDKSGELDARVWDNAEKLALICTPGSVVKVLAQSQSYKGILQLKVINVDHIGDMTYDLSLFLPASDCDIDEMENKLIKFIEAVKDQDLRKLLQSFVNDHDLWSDFKKAPAAKMMHHAYIGGLLEHTLAICTLVEQVSETYPLIDKSLLMAGAVLHDIGKIKEFSFDVPPFDYSDQGRLVGHMVLAIEMIQEKIAQQKNFPTDKAMLLKHLVLGHHGRHDFGSPTLPMTREAFVLNFLDDLDAKMNYLDRLSEKSGEQGYQWTEYQRGLERFLYVNSPLEQDHIVTERADSISSPRTSQDEKRQQSLWE